MPTISIIVPAYNAERTIELTITSILSQSFEDFELIIVNDGSNDSTLNICKRFKDNRIVIIDKENGGLSNARNTGIYASKGKYICFVDGDDIIDINYLNLLYSSLIDTDSDLAICGMQLLTRDDTSILNFYENKCYKNIWNDNEFLIFFQQGLLNSACNKLYKAAIIKNNNLSFPKQTLTEDIAFNIEYFKLSFSISTIKEPLYIYQLQNSQLTKKVSEDMFTNYLKIHANLLEIVPYEKHIYIHQFVYHQYISIIIRYLSHINNHLLNKKEIFLLLDKYLTNSFIKKAFHTYRPTNYKDYIFHTLMKFKCFTIILLYLKR